MAFLEANHNIDRNSNNPKAFRRNQCGSPKMKTHDGKSNEHIVRFTGIDDAYGTAEILWHALESMEARSIECRNASFISNRSSRDDYDINQRNTTRVLSKLQLSEMSGNLHLKMKTKLGFGPTSPRLRRSVNHVCIVACTPGPQKARMSQCMFDTWLKHFTLAPGGDCRSLERITLSTKAIQERVPPHTKIAKVS